MDGSKVTNRQALFEPPLDSRKPDDADESLEERKAWTEEKNRELREQMDKDESDGLDVAEKFACTKAVSSYDLSPRYTSN